MTSQVIREKSDLCDRPNRGKPAATVNDEDKTEEANAFVTAERQTAMKGLR